MKQQGLEFFDCNASFGFRKVMEPGSFYLREELAKKMRYYGIGRALVYHAMAREYDAASGNRKLMDEIKGIPEFVPLWVIMPHHTGEFPDPEKLKQLMKENEVRAATIFPAVSEHNYSMEEWCCGELLSMLETCRVPLFISLDQTDWNEINRLCSAYPELRLVITNVNYRIDRLLYPLLERHPNLYVETSGYKNHRGIEEICSRFGAGRLLFGSGMPVYSGGAAVASILYSEIGEEEKKKIAGRNLEMLLEGVRL